MRDAAGHWATGGRRPVFPRRSPAMAEGAKAQRALAARKVGRSVGGFGETRLLNQLRSYKKLKELKGGLGTKAMLRHPERHELRSLCCFNPLALPGTGQARSTRNVSGRSPFCTPPFEPPCPDLRVASWELKLIKATISGLPTKPSLQNP